MAVNIKQIVDAYATRVNNQDFNIAEDINNLQAALKGIAYAALTQGEFANTEILSANRTLTNDDRVMQFLNPNTDDRDVILPAVGATNHSFLIVNTNGGNYTLTVKTAGGSEVATLLPGKNAFFASNAAQWIVLAGGGVSEQPAQVLYTHGQATSVPAASTRYMIPGMTQSQVSLYSIPLPAGTFRNLNVRQAGTQVGGTMTFKLFGGPLGSLTDTGIGVTFAIGSGAQERLDTTNIYKHTDGHHINFVLQNNAPSDASAIIGGVTIDFLRD